MSDLELYEKLLPELQVLWRYICTDFRMTIVDQTTVLRKIAELERELDQRICRERTKETKA